MGWQLIIAKHCSLAIASTARILRLRLLGYDCALERLKHTVGAMRLLSSHAAHEAAGAGARAAVGSEGAGGGWLRVVWEEAPAQRRSPPGGWRMTGRAVLA